MAKVRTLQPSVATLAQGVVRSLERQDSRAIRLTSRPWSRLRAQVLVRDKYLCQECLRKGLITEGCEVDHKVPLSQGGTNDLANLELLCTPCHAVKSAAEGVTGSGSTPGRFHAPRGGCSDS